jgi:hypothetical protein
LIFVFCVFSLVSGTLQKRFDGRPSGLKGPARGPSAVVFGRVP